MTVLNSSNESLNFKSSNINQSNWTILKCLSTVHSSPLPPPLPRRIVPMSFRHQPYSVHQQRNQRNNKSSPPCSVLKSYQTLNWQWWATSHSLISVSDDGKSVCFFPSGRSLFQTAAHRGSQALRPNALTYWEIVVHLPSSANATSLMFGIGTAQTPLVTNEGYVNLLGADTQSWALSHKGLVWHDNQSREFCDNLEIEETTLTVGCLFDGFNGRLAYFKSGKCLGVAFDNIPMNCYAYYPMVASTLAHSLFEFTVTCEHFASLKEICRRAINNNPITTDTNFLPRHLIEYLTK